MRSTLITTGLMASLALAGPLAKRKLVTVTNVDTIFTTVTVSSIPGSTTTVATVTVTDGALPAPEPTSTEATSTDEPTTTVIVPAPTTTEAPVEPTPEPTTQVLVEASTSASAEAPVASSTGANAYQNLILDSHNVHRANHSADALTWSDSLAATAQKIAATCVYGHDTSVDGGGYGQNIGAGTSAEEIDTMITNLMYNGEIGFYPTPYGQKSPNMSNFSKWGHFSQIVWKETTQVGCATVSCGSLANVGGSVPPVFTVCNYSPPGNFAGQYDNVGAPLGKSTVTA